MTGMVMIATRNRRTPDPRAQSAQIYGDISNKLNDATARIGSAISAFDGIKDHLQGDTKRAVEEALEELRDLQSKIDGGFIGRTRKRLRNELVPAVEGALDSSDPAERISQLDRQFARASDIAGIRIDQLDILAAAEQSARRLAKNISSMDHGMIRASIGAEKAASNEPAMVESLGNMDFAALEKQISDLVYARYALNGVESARSLAGPSSGGIEMARRFINDYPSTFDEITTMASGTTGGAAGAYQAAPTASTQATSETPAVAMPTATELLNPTIVGSMERELIAIEGAELMRSLEAHAANIGNMISDYTGDPRSYVGSALGTFIESINTENLVLFSKAHIYATGHPGDAALIGEISELLRLSNNAMLNLSDRMRADGRRVEPLTVPFERMADHGQAVLSAIAEATAESRMADSMRAAVLSRLTNVLTGPAVPAGAAGAVLDELYKDMLLMGAERREPEADAALTTLEPGAAILLLLPEDKPDTP